jgi:hypothetical protein
MLKLSDSSDVLTYGFEYAQQFLILGKGGL